MTVNTCFRFSGITALAMLAVGLHCAVVPLHAQQTVADSKADASEAIIVNGSRLTPEQARDQAIAFVRGVGVAFGDRSVARWEAPVCPHIIGLESVHAQIVEKTLRRIAWKAKIPYATAPCHTNVVVTFTTDAGAVVRRISSRAIKSLSEVPLNARDVLRNGDAPVRWWYTTDVRSKDGMSASAAPAPWTSGNAEGGGSVLPDTGRSLNQYGSSIISTQAIRVLKSATIIVDANLAEGHTLDAVASYIAMVAFAEISSNDFAPSGSILSTFVSAEASAVTDWDLAFLRALYRLPLDRKARQQRNILVAELTAAAMRNDPE